MGEFDGKVALVTGAARGIGAAVAELLAGGRRSDGAATFSPEGLYLTGVDYQRDGLPDCWGTDCLSGLPS